MDSKRQLAIFSSTIVGTERGQGHSHFALRQARYGLVAVGSLILVFSVIQLLGLPGPPA